MLHLTLSPQGSEGETGSGGFGLCIPMIPCLVHELLGSLSLGTLPYCFRVDRIVFLSNAHLLRLQNVTSFENLFPNLYRVRIYLCVQNGP